MPLPFHNFHKISAYLARKENRFYRPSQGHENFLVAALMMAARTAPEVKLLTILRALFRSGYDAKAIYHLALFLSGVDAEGNTAWLIDYSMDWNAVDVVIQQVTA